MAHPVDGNTREVKVVRIEEIRRNERAAVFIGAEHGAEVSFHPAAEMVTEWLE